MATKRSRRTHTKAHGTKPHTGRRYVQGGKVRIEWYEGGKRRSRTIGPHTPEMLARADATLQELLANLDKTGAPVDSAEKQAPESADLSFRELALLLLDAADQVADGLRNAAQEVMSEISESSGTGDEKDTDS